MKKIALCLILLLVTSIGFSASNNNPRAFIIDADLGVDSDIAVLYFLQRPDIDVKAISLDTNESTHCKSAIENMRGFLQLTHQSSIPLACGRDQPLKGNHHFPTSVIKESDTRANTPLAFPQLPLPKQDAVDLILNTLHHSSKPVEILAFGSLTTIAEVLQRDPTIKNKITRIYYMGGAIHVRGNIQDVVPASPNKNAEWNIYIDPYAAQMVFSSRVPITLVPLDVTNQFPIDIKFYKGIQSQHSSAAKFIYQMLDNNKKLLYPDKGAYWWYLWDPLTAVIAYDSSICKQKTLPLSISQSPEAHSGAINIDTKHRTLIQVCTTVNRKGFTETLINGL